MSDSPRETSLGELAALFLRLGTTAFGGPAAHIAMLEDEVVGRRRWLSRDTFLDYVGATNLIPGPNSTELAIHVGRRRAGTAGLLVAGVCFILPAAVMVLACAWAYRRYGQVPVVAAMWDGVKPVVLAIVLVAMARFARSALTRPLLVGTACAATILSAFRVHELLVLLVAGLLVLAGRAGLRPRAALASVLVPWWLVPPDAASPALGPIFRFFLQVGSVLFGSGYVLLAFLRSGLVERHGWLTEAQLLDAVAVGQMTPGPVFTTATFVGFLLAGTPGAIAATVGIFLPAFLLVGISDRLLHWIGGSPSARAFLDGVVAGSLGLLALVTWQLGRAAVTSPTAALVTLACLALLGVGINSSWLILAGAAVGPLLR